TPLLNGVEHANFFETRATEYSKGATKGDWQSVWSNFDQRRKAKANDTASEAIEGGEEDMFKQAGIAAE
ncbi:MAG: ribonucleotide-diphosphate reductase subunit beta, partial [Novosphingobium sp.]